MKNIFRQSALNRLSSPEELNSLLQVTSVKGWLALAGLGLLIITAVLWAILGSLPTKLVAQQCILVKNGGVNVLSSSAGGRLSDLAVDVGDKVTRGQIIGRLEQSDLLQKIHASEAHLKEVQAQYDQAMALADKNEKSREIASSQQKQGLLFQLATADRKAKLLRERIDTQTGLYDQGLITKQTLIESQLELSSVLLEQKTIDTQVKQLQVTRLDAEKQSENELASLKNQLEDAKRTVTMMIREAKDFASIVSPYTGRVLEIKATEGQLVERGTPLISIESSSSDANEIEAYVYLPAAEGKKVSSNMNVEVSPSTAKREEFGFLRAIVASVADYPSTDQGLMRVFGNDKLVRNLTGDLPPIQIRASLIPSGLNPSHYQWSTRSGPPFQIQSGTSCSAAITVSEQRPIELALPILKKILELG
ncbi:NHLP bacteriocin system secretion protein [Massilia pinisoli]|uniref:NHLP bacteriocin system secretion protein n=1 Tax=Massilia pinisoli TaxID=1772194 RepID=A0ABT1ZUK5_9BURK|nr:NHLP bacteriocin system secretion protein [Massilia pinisoli]MCS0583570.1 NHLP bacteriocin system secretion protein [Massilia pinisoli]